MMNQTSQMNQTDHSQSLEKGFELAYFITQDRTSAIEILAGALDKLSVQCRREKRRFYWRYIHPCPIRRMSHQELDAFQWLILLESEPCERAQELMGDHSLRDMVVRYVKHLVQITTSMSSFYVCVGMNRLLYSYSTSETQAAFELITQRFLGADQYRRAKKMLTSRLRDRFGKLVEPVKARHGEIRFRTLDDQSSWHGLVQECLSMFSPWSTAGYCDQFMLKVDDLRQSRVPVTEPPPRGPDAQETIYCHMFIEPGCRGNLSEILSLSSPEARLALPRFAMKDETNENDGNKTQTSRVPNLCDEEKALIARRLNESRARRRKVRPAAISVIVDGTESSRFDLTSSAQLQIELADGARLIEIRGIDEDGEILLGTHLISYADQAFESSKIFQSLRNGQLRLEISPNPNTGEGARATLTLSFERRFQRSREIVARIWRLIRFQSSPEDMRCRCHYGTSGALNF